MLDPRFAQHGSETLQPLPGLANSAMSLAIAQGGDLLIGGSAATSRGASASSGAGFLLRLHPNGVVDSSFGWAGLVPLPGLSGITEIEPTPDGHILVLGGSIVRLDHNGGRDLSFGSDGAAVLPSSFTPSQFVIDGDGAITLIGTAKGLGEGSTAVAVARLTADGQPDLSFGVGGIALLAQSTDPRGYPLSEAMPRGLAVQPDGSVIVTLEATAVKGSEPPVIWPVSLVERVTAAGSVDTSFGVQGEVRVSGLLGAAVGAFHPLLSQTGAILVPIVALVPKVAESSALTFRDLIIYSISSDGHTTSERPDSVTDFEPIGPLLALPDGGYLVVSDLANRLFPGLHLSYFHPNLDSYPDDPLIGFEEPVALPRGASDSHSLIAVQPDGKLVIAGSSTESNGQEAVFVARLLGISQAIAGLPRQRIRHGAQTVRLRLTCSPAQDCHGTATLSITLGHHYIFLGSGDFSIAAGASRKVAIRLTSSGRRRLAGSHARRVVLTLRTANGPVRVAQMFVPAA